LTAESLASLFGRDVKLDEAMRQIESDVKLFKSASRIIRETREFSSKIEELTERIRHTYQYVQERCDASPNRDSIEAKLEGFFKDMNSLKETMMKRVKNHVNEGDLTIKLTGVPDDLDVEDLGIDLITGDEDEEFEPGAGEEVSDLGGEEGEMGDEPAPELPAGDEEGEDHLSSDEVEEGHGMEDLDDDDVVEISESMLRSEIKRMRTARLVREGKMPVEDFGGGKDEGDAYLDGEVTTAENSCDEGVEEDEDADDLDEGYGMDEEDEDLDAEGLGTGAAKPIGQKSEAAVLKGRLQNEVRAYHAALSEFRTLVAEAKGAKSPKKAAAAKKAAAKAKAAKAKASETAKKVKEAAAKKAPAAKKVTKEGLENRGSAKVAEDRGNVESLRSKLNESNLFNAKLLASNKLLQNESLSAKQKTSAIERLDEAKTVREVKLVYESIAKALSGRRSLAEGAGRLVGSSSRTTTSGASLNESVETDRWAILAGIK
jgi:hypothetical protein